MLKHINCLHRLLLTQNLNQSSLIIFIIFLSHVSLPRTDLYLISNIYSFIHICTTSFIIYLSSYHSIISPVYWLAGVSFSEVVETEMNKLCRSIYYDAHNTRPLIRTLKYSQEIIACGRSRCGRRLKTHANTEEVNYHRS